MPRCVLHWGGSYSPWHPSGLDASVTVSWIKALFKSITLAHMSRGGCYGESLAQYYKGRQFRNTMCKNKEMEINR